MSKNIYGFQRLNMEGDKYYEGIHYNALFGSNVKLGEHVVIDEGCRIGHNVIIGHGCVLRKNVTIHDNTVIGHLTVFESDCEIGSNVLIHAQCHITTCTIIEDYVFMAPFCITMNTKIIVRGRSLPLVLEGPIIRFGARLGVGVKVLPGVEIGEEAMVGVGAIVTRDVLKKKVWYGSPAAYVSVVPEEELLSQDKRDNASLIGLKKRKPIMREKI